MCLKKILFLSHSREMGGAEKSLIDFILAAKENPLGNDYVHCVACPPGGYFSSYLQSLGIEVRSLPFFLIQRSINPIVIILNILKLIHVTIKLIFVLKNFDLAHANSSQVYLQSLPAVIVTKKPIVWHLRDFHKDLFFRNILEKRATKIIPISKAVQTTLLNPYHRKVKQIYNGVSVNYTNSHVTNSIFKEKYLLMVAQSVRWKRHDLAIEAMGIIRQKYPKLKLVIVANDLNNNQTEYLNYLKKKVIKTGLTKQIYFLRYQENIVQLIKQSTLLIHPANNEPLGRIVVEAMKLGKIVVVSNNGGFVEYVKDGVHGFVFRNNNAKDCAHKIISVLKHPQEEQIILNAKKKANNLFDVLKQSNKLLLQYKEILECRIDSDGHV